VCDLAYVHIICVLKISDIKQVSILLQKLNFRGLGK
jgi:hypothetical protein